MDNQSFGEKLEELVRKRAKIDHEIDSTPIANLLDHEGVLVLKNQKKRIEELNTQFKAICYLIYEDEIDKIKENTK